MKISYELEIQKLGKKTNKQTNIAVMLQVPTQRGSKLYVHCADIKETS